MRCQVSVHGVGPDSSGLGGLHAAGGSVPRAWGKGAVGVGCSGVHKEAKCAQSIGECAWCGISIHQVWSECAQRESAPSVGEGTGCGVIWLSVVWDKGECAQHA